MAPQSSQAPLEFGGPLGAAVLLLLLPATMIHLLLVARSGPARLLGPPPYLPGLEALWSPRALLLLLGWLGLQAALYLLPARQVAEGQELKDKSRLRYPINGFQALVLTALLVVLGLAAGLPLRALPDMLLPLAFAATLTAFVFSLLLYLKAQAAPASALAPGGKSGNPIYDFFLGRELNPRIYSFDFKYFCELRPGLIGWGRARKLSVRAWSRTGGMAHLAAARQDKAGKSSGGPHQPGPAAAGGRAAGEPLAGHVAGQRLPAALRGRRAVERGGCAHHHGHHARRLWLHAGFRGPGVGPLHLQPAGPVPAAPPSAAGAAHGLGHLPPQWSVSKGRQPRPLLSLPLSVTRAIQHPLGRCGASGRALAPGAGLGVPGVGQAALTASPDHASLPTAVGYYIFRGANSQKNTFRKNPSDPRVAGEPGLRGPWLWQPSPSDPPPARLSSDLETIPTATGRRLLVSGWWGMVRHPNYLGDLLMALAWSLPCGECPGGGGGPRWPWASSRPAGQRGDPCGPSPQGCRTCCPTSTSSTSRRCWCTGRPATSGSACRSTAARGWSTAGACRTASCPTSTERPRPGGDPSSPA
uniref:Delta(14)-sterol reductase TM7SF2 n=1 Tax=Oryctolagus cuniculus TaxID=9986 RepID=A0A5F9DPZ7_RABIT